MGHYARSGTTRQAAAPGRVAALPGRQQDGTEHCETHGQDAAAGHGTTRLFLKMAPPPRGEHRLISRRAGHCLLPRDDSKF